MLSLNCRSTGRRVLWLASPTRVAVQFIGFNLWRSADQNLPPWFCSNSQVNGILANLATASRSPRWQVASSAAASLLVAQFA